MKIGANTYKLILLDTNAIREIVMNSSNSGKGFLQRFFYDSSEYAPCFSIYNVIELRPYRNIYENFIDFFSAIPCLMIFSMRQILHEEYACYLQGKKLQINNITAQAFTPLVLTDSYNLRSFLGVMEDKLTTSIASEIEQLPDVAIAWQNKRDEARKLLEKMELPKDMIDENFFISQERETIIKDLINQGIVPRDNTDISFLPAARIMEYSQFNRLHIQSKPIKPNDVMDIMISCITPYVDAVITEGFQGDIYRKAKRIISQLSDLEIFKLRDIRLEE